MVKRKFEVTRTGKVHFFVWGPNHCGMENFIQGGFIVCKYEVCLLATGALDEKGFLIDNMFISKYMEQAAEKGTSLSCELLLEQLSDGLREAMQSAEPSLEILAFTISLSPDFGPDSEAKMKIFYSAEEAA